MEIVIAIATKIAEYTIEPIGRQVGYLYFYDNKVTELRNQVITIGFKKQRLQQAVGEAESDGNKIFEDVQTWLTKVDGITAEADKLTDRASQAKPSCFNGTCLNLKSRHQLSRKSKKMAEKISIIVGEGSTLLDGRVSYRVAPQGIGTEAVKGYEVFDSRNSTLIGVIEALKSDNINKVGVYGMGGVGKTMLVKKVAQQAKDLKLFDKVVLVVISQTPNLKEIQDKIAYVLDLKFDAEATRVDKLREQLKREKSILIIIDDIWEELKLEDAGISFGDDQKGCKLLFTSRSIHVLLGYMDSPEIFTLEILSNDEPRYLFEKIVGGLPEDTGFRSVADEVVKECAGLPLAVTVIANALKKDKSLHVWNDAVHQLRMSNPTTIEGVSKELYSTIELSYNFLSKEAKQLFLLCSLFGEDSEIPFELLLRDGMGLDLFEDVYHLEDVRNRVHTLVGNLKSSSLLLDGEKDDTVKMHDVIRDVAIHIASKAEHMFIVENAGKLQELSKRKKLKDSVALSILYNGGNVCEFLARLECSRLKLLLFSYSSSLQIPHPFFEGMKELRVLNLNRINSQYLLSSISLLKNLQTLYLKDSVLKNIAFIGELENLKVLSLSESDIKEFPKEISQLTNLQVLDLSNCSKLEIIPANVLSNLKSLEELYMEKSFSSWEVEGESTEGSIARVTELDHLSHLTTLNICIPSAKFLPKALIFEKLVRYKIFIGDDSDWHRNYKNSRILALKLNISLQSEYLDMVKILLKSCEVLYLGELKGVQNILPNLNSDGFPQLKHLEVKDNAEIQSIINLMGLRCATFPVLESFYLNRMINLEKICHGQLAVGSLNKLRIIEVKDCDDLKFVFPLSMAGCFPQLQKMNITNCKVMSTIIAMEREDETEIIDVDYRLHFNKKVWFSNLTTLTVGRCASLKYLLSSSMARSLVQLQALEIYECKVMQEIVVTEESGEEKRIDNIVFPKLESLDQRNLPKLMRFCFGNLIELPSLKDLKITDCNELKTFVSNSLSANLTVNKELEEMNNCATQSPFNEKVLIPNLMKMEINGMDNLRMIWHNKLALDSFCKLKEMMVTHCKNLMNIFPSNIQIRRLQSLKILKVIDCELLEDVFEIGGTNVKETGDVVATQLMEMYLYNLPKLKNVWNLNPQGIFLTFQNLHSVVIKKCKSLKSLFPASVAKNLMELKSLTIYNCGVEYIVAKEEGLETEPKFVFPLLNSFELQNMPELKSFYLGKHTLEWPLLKKLEIRHCGKVKIFASDSLSFQEAHGLGHHGVSFEQPLFLIEKVSFPKLEELSLRVNFAMNEIWRGHSPIEFFSKLKVLNLLGFYDKSVVFPNGFLQRLSNLVELRVVDSQFREIFLYEELGVEKHGGTLAQFKKLYLSGLPELVHLQKENSQAHPFFQKLETLAVVQCDKLKNLVPSSISFQNLTSLYVDNCHGLLNLITSSTAKSLVQLTHVYITNCKNMTEIVANEGGEAGDDEILFTQLKSLKLFKLPNLTSFYLGNCNIKFSYLNEVIVERCPKLAEDFLSWNVKHTKAA